MKKKDNRIVIIDNKYTEGLSLSNCENMHIIEPCLNYSDQQQLETRIVRLGNYPKNYHVNIINYIPTISKIFSEASKIKNYLNDNTYKWYTSITSTHDQNITPDSKVILSHEILKESIKKTEKYLSVNLVKLKERKECQKSDCIIQTMDQKSIKKSCQNIIKNKIK